MLHLRNVVQKLSNKETESISLWLKQNEADKCVELLHYLRITDLDESTISSKLKTSASGYYALRSRLSARIQDFFAHNAPEANIDLIKNVANIPNLLYNTPRELALTQLLKIEKELIKLDIPHALTEVYSALKKISRHSPKYFEYSQQYNKHLAYNMAIDKAKELLLEFNKYLGEYKMSADSTLLEVLEMLKQEMINYAKLYQSHRLEVYKNILIIEYLLFIDGKPKKGNEKIIEEHLSVTEKVIATHKHDASYSFLKTLMAYLRFQFCLYTKQEKNATTYYKQVDHKLNIFLLNNFSCFPSHFLLEKSKLLIESGEVEKLYEEYNLLSESYTPYKEDVANYINYKKFSAAASFGVKKYGETAAILNELINEVSLKHFPFAELEIKLFLALSLLLNNKPGIAKTFLKNIQRRAREYDSLPFDIIRLLTKLLLITYLPPGRIRKMKISNNLEKYRKLNNGAIQLLECILIDESLLESITNSNVLA